MLKNGPRNFLLVFSKSYNKFFERNSPIQITIISKNVERISPHPINKLIKFMQKVELIF